MSCDNAPRFFVTLAAVSKHADLASRIFRTVVFSGAMLGTTTALAQPKPAPPQQAAPAKAEPAVPPDTWDSVTKEIEATDKKLDTAIVRYIAAHKDAFAKKEGSGTNMALASQSVAELRKARLDLDARRAKTTRPAPPKPQPAVDTAERTLADADTKLFASIDAVESAKEDADMKKAIGDLEKARKERVAAASKLKTEVAKANKRPRTPVRERPVGRGFVLA